MNLGAQVNLISVPPLEVTRTMMDRATQVLPGARLWKPHPDNILKYWRTDTIRTCDLCLPRATQQPIARSRDDPMRLETGRNLTSTLWMFHNIR